MNSTPTTVAPLVALESVLRTEELNRRPARPPNYETENRALKSLAQALADSPRTILQILADTILEVLQAGSTGISLMMEDEKRFHWPAIAGGWKSYIGSGTPRDFGPCGDVLDRNCPLLFSNPQRRYPYLLEAMPQAEECLLVPFHVAGQAVGTLWAIAHDERRKFDNEDLRMLVSLGTFASAAYQALEQVQTLADAQARQQSDQTLREMNESLLLSSVKQHELTQKAETAEAAAHESEARFRALVTASSDVVYRMSPDWSEMRQLAGRNFIADSEQSSGTWLQEYIPPDDQPLVLAVIQEAIRTKTIFELEHRVLNLDGTFGWTFSRAVPLLDPQGEIVEWFGTASDVTERKRAEDALRESEERYRNLFTSMDEGYCILELIFDEHEQPVDYRFVEVNPSFEKQTGLHDATGKRMRELHPDHEQHWFEIYGQVALTGEPVRYVNEAKTMEGRWFDGYAFQVGGRDSRKVAVLFNDITQRRQSEEALRQRAIALAEAQRETLETLALVDALISNAPIGMAYYDHDLRFVRLNQALADINGLPLEAHLGRTIQELLPGIPEKSLDQFRQVLATGRPILNYEVRGETPKAPGEMRWWLVNYYPVQVQADKVHTKDTLGVGVAVLEITQQKRAELAQRESAQRLRFVLDSMPQKIFTATPNGNIDYFNPQWTEFTGLSFEQMMDSGWSKLVHPDDLDEKIRQWRHAFDTGEPFQSEHRFRRADGKYRWHISRALPMRDATGRITMWVGSNTDVHAMKQAEAALQEKAVELSELHRRKDEFLAMLSHELRSPLAPIANAVQLLGLQKAGESRIQQQARGIIERQVGQLQHLVDDLLEVSRITTGRVQLRLERIDICRIAEGAVETVRPLIEQRRHELTVLLPQEPVWMVADAARLEQVLVNLLTNASKYTEGGGQIWLTVEVVASDEWRVASEKSGEWRVTSGEEKSGEWRVTSGEKEKAESDILSIPDLTTHHSPLATLSVVIRVRDTGVGISPALVPHVFDLFTQADRSLDRSQGGLGIGLALVQRLTELHGGKVEAFSTVGEGSEFVVRLPVRSDEWRVASGENGASSSLTTEHSPLATPLRVLVVDDNVDTVLGFSMLLKASGHDVRTANDGLAAVEAAIDYRPDVVLLDIGLPGLNGYEVAKRLRQHPDLKHTVLIALTGYGQDTDRQTSQQAGFDHHLVKPARFDQLKKILTTVQEGLKV